MISKKKFQELLDSQRYDQLKDFKVDNAVILAAGLSSRFKPFSEIKPKALARIKAEVLIERQIRQLQEAGIDNIYVVVGYRKNEFEYLKTLGVKLIENDSYNQRNNTGSMILLGDILNNTYICSSDNYFKENVFTKYNYKAYYASVYKEGETSEWCLKTNSDDEIVGVSVGGCDSYVMMGQVYFDKKFSKQFLKLLKENYDDEKVKANVWEYLYMQYLDILKMEIKKYPQDIILEFDSIAEVEEFDLDFRKNNQDVFKQIETNK